MWVLTITSKQYSGVVTFWYLSTQAWVPTITNQHSAIVTFIHWKPSSVDPHHHLQPTFRYGDLIHCLFQYQIIFVHQITYYKRDLVYLRKKCVCICRSFFVKPSTWSRSGYKARLLKFRSKMSCKRVRFPYFICVQDSRSLKTVQKSMSP